MTNLNLGSIQIKRGSHENKPELLEGEFFYAIDTRKLHVGTSNGSVIINTSGSGGSELGMELTVNSPLGLIPNGTVLPPETTEWDVLMRMLRQAIPPTYLAPLLTLTGTQSGNQEIGTTITPTLTSNFNQRDGGAMVEYRLSQGGMGIIFTNPTTAPHTIDSFDLLSTTTFNAQVDFGDGPILNDSLGDPHPEGRIMAGTVSSGNVTYTPVRRSFFGGLMGDVPSNSTEVRLLPQTTLNPTNNTTLTVNIVNGFGAVWCYPSTLRMPISLTSQALGNIPVGNLTHELVTVEGMNGHASIEYRVLYFTTATTITDNYSLVI